MEKGVKGKIIDLEELKTRIFEGLNNLSSQFSPAQLLAILFLVVLLTLGGFLLYRRNQPTPIKIKETPALTEEKKKAKPDRLLIYVTGAVKNPDVYELKREARVIEAIKKAGGALEEANLEVLNLAAKLNDGEKIYVPRKGEATLSNQAPKVAGETPQSPLINLNMASLEELDKLPGIGPALSERIIEYREAKGGFKKVEELQGVEGIGPKKFLSIKDKVTLN